MNLVTYVKKFKAKYIFILIYIFSSVFLYSQMDYPSSLSFIINGGVISFANILLSFYLGYWGIAVSSITSMFSIAGLFNLASRNGSSLIINILTIQLSIWFAAILISILSEKEKKVRARIEWLTIRDDLSGLYNTRYFHSEIEKAIKRIHENESNSVTLCIIDLDKFKYFNDVYGHRQGDHVINIAGSIISKNIRNTDTACRYGGDEFVIIMPNACQDVVQSILDKIKEAFKDEIAKYPSQASLSLSMGCSTYPQCAKTKEELFDQADAPLYKAKNMGRNNYKVYHDVIADIGHNTSNNQQLKTSIKVLLQVISEKDKYTYGHSERVAEFAVTIAQALKLPEEKINALEIEGLLHDIGKIKIPNQILNKKEKLTAEEFNLVKKHSIYSADIIESLSLHRIDIEDIRHHHERFDGQGYPGSLKGEAIPLGSRILAVADAYDAMISDRPYRNKSLSFGEAEHELIHNSGTQFDPQIVNVFLNSIGHLYEGL